MAGSRFDQLPPMHELLAFEAAARHRSFRKAAEELYVTASAVSHRVRSLERRLGKKLFSRTTRQVKLTEVGAGYLAKAVRSLEALEKAQRDEAGKPRVARVSLLTMDSFASCWLVARLPSFKALRPDVEVRIITTTEMNPFDAHSADLAILYGQASDWPEHRVRLLAHERISPVCTPALPQRGETDLDLTDLPKLPLLHDDKLCMTWFDYFQQTGALPESTGWHRAVHQGPKFNHSHLALKAAEGGQGVALASSPLADDAIAEGRLVRASPKTVETGNGYFLVSAREECSESVRALAGWLIEAAKA